MLPETPMRIKMRHSKPHSARNKCLLRGNDAFKNEIQLGLVFIGLLLTVASRR